MPLKGLYSTYCWLRKHLLVQLIFSHNFFFIFSFSEIIGKFKWPTRTLPLFPQLSVLIQLGLSAWSVYTSKCEDLSKILTAQVDFSIPATSTQVQMPGNSTLSCTSRHSLTKPGCKMQSSNADSLYSLFCETWWCLVHKFRQERHLKWGRNDHGIVCYMFLQLI